MVCERPGETELEGEGTVDTASEVLKGIGGLGASISIYICLTSFHVNYCEQCILRTGHRMVKCLSTLANAGTFQRNRDYTD